MKRVLILDAFCCAGHPPRVGDWHDSDDEAADIINAILDYNEAGRTP